MQPGSGGGVVEAEVVYGMVIEDVAAAKLARKVINISVLVVLVQFCWFLLRDNSTNVASFMMTLAVPACGYYGAKNRNRALIQWYWMCNMLAVMQMSLSVVMLLFILQASNQSSAEDATREYKHCLEMGYRPGANTHMSPAQSNHCNQARYIHEVYEFGPSTMLLIMSAHLVINFLGCVWGKALYESDYLSLSEGEGGHAANFGVAAPISAYAAHAQPAARTSSARAGGLTGPPVTITRSFSGSDGSLSAGAAHAPAMVTVPAEFVIARAEPVTLDAASSGAHGEVHIGSSIALTTASVPGQPAAQEAVRPANFHTSTPWDPQFAGGSQPLPPALDGMGRQRFAVADAVVDDEEATSPVESTELNPVAGSADADDKPPGGISL